MWDKIGDIKLPFATQTTPKGTEGTNKSVLEMHGTFTIILLITVSLNKRERGRAREREREREVISGYSYAIRVWQ